MEITTGKNKMGKEKKYLEVNKTKGSLIFIWVCIFLLIFETYVFMAGYHNVDTSWNVLNSAYNLNLAQNELQLRNITDTGSDWITRPIESYYIHGLNQMTLSFFSAIFTMYVLASLMGEK